VYLLGIYGTVEIGQQAWLQACTMLVRSTVLLEIGDLRQKVNLPKIFFKN